MKPEPLKDKLYICKSALRCRNFEEKEIKSAVEWLKKEINSLPTDITLKQFKIQLWHIILKAFEDVMK